MKIEKIFFFHKNTLTFSQAGHLRSCFVSCGIEPFTLVNFIDIQLCKGSKIKV